MVQQNLADITSNVMIYNYNLFPIVDYTLPVQGSPWCIAVRRAPPVNFARVLLLPFHGTAWAGIFLSLISGATVWHFTIYITSAVRSSKKGFQHTLLYVIQLTFNGACSQPPTRLHQRLVFGALFLFVLVLSNAYQGKLLGFLTAPPSPTQMQTLHEAAIKLNRIYSYTTLANMWEDDDDDTVKDIQRKMELVDFDDITKKLRDVTKTDEEGFLMEQAMYLFYSKMEELTDDGKTLFHFIPECVLIPGHLAHVVRKNSPLSPIFSSFVSHVVEGGLYSHWHRAQAHRMACNGVSVPQTETGATREPRALRFVQFSGAFEVLAVGLGGAIVVFLLELLVKRHPRNLRGLQNFFGRRSSRQY